MSEAAISPQPDTLPPPEHFDMLVGKIMEGSVVPFLGAGASLWGRKSDLKPFQPGQYLPNGAELASYLAPAWPVERLDLLRVSQYIDLTQGSGPLYRKLREVFNFDYPITPLHELLADLPTCQLAKGYPVHHPLIVTTNYDHLLETAFVRRGQEFDQVTYVANGANVGRFRYRKWRRDPQRPDGPPQPGPPEIILRPNEDTSVSLDTCPVILKIHGTVCPEAPRLDSYVITEDDYIEYLARTDPGSFLPARLKEKLEDSHILFLGYALKDWNLRVILHRIWGNRELTWNSWSVQLRCEELDRRLWARQGVEILETRVEDYINEVRRRIERLPAASRA